MTAILSVLAVLGSALWYYRAAMAKGLPAIQWAVAGAILYYGGFLLWMHGILKMVIGPHFQVHSFWVGISMDVSAIGFGFAVALVFKLLVLDKRGR
jgi:hypothetical protein